MKDHLLMDLEKIYPEKLNIHGKWVQFTQENGQKGFKMV